MSIFTSLCVICGTTFEARHSYGLCSLCSSRDRLREFDRLQSAIRSAERQHLPATLSLVQLLSVISDYKSLCSFCLKVPFSMIHMVNRHDGLVYGNVVLVCRSCEVHTRESFHAAEMRVNAYLADVLADDLQYHGEEVDGVDRSCVPSDAALRGDAELLDFMRGGWS
jgi:hypothetical protein